MGTRKRRAPSPPEGELPSAGEASDDGGDGDDGDGGGDSRAHAGDPASPPAPAAPPSKGRAPAALAWMRDARTLDVEADELDAAGVSVDARLTAALRAAGIERLFAVQAAVWSTLHGGRGAHDLCIHAPTGSGKTLAYALPVVAALSGRVIRRLRAVVVLPTHDLAQQVAAVFQPLCQAVGLDAAVASGKGPLSSEAAALVQTQGSRASSCVDVLVATPGRLVAHMRSTPGFTLQHLQFLVVDEADRLLRQAYQDWLPAVLAATAPATVGSTTWGLQAGSLPAVPSQLEICEQRRFRGGAQGDRVATPRLVKLVVSATLTRDPSKIGRLELYSPILLTASATDQRYRLAPQLRQWRVVVAAEEKPLALLALLQQLSGQLVMVFAGSVDATRRLYSMLDALDDSLPVNCVEYSSLQSHTERSRALESFRRRDATVLVASDAATRGLDVEGVDVVISYDTPVYLKTYVHRVGRTARAGRAGEAYTLLQPCEVHHFKAMLSKADTSRVAAHKVTTAELAAVAPACALALSRVEAATAPQARVRAS